MSTQPKKSSLNENDPQFVLMVSAISPGVLEAQ